MNIFGQNNHNPKDIYFYRPDLPHIDTFKHFEISEEKEKLRVQNHNVNCLFSNLTFQTFDQIYNDFNHYLNLDFEPVKIDGKFFELSKNEKEKLFEQIITNWIYYYTINNLNIEVKRSDFTHPYMVDYVLSILDKEFPEDTNESLTLGAKILRQDLDKYTNTVIGRRLYYDR